jgi:pimeloyl-ACP methyl ester carboxylesterase
VTFPVRRCYLDGHYGQVHVRTAGSHGVVRPLVCFHQSPLSGRIFEPLMAELGTDRLVVAPGTPGYGASDPPPRPLSIANYPAAQSFCEQVNTALYYIDYEFKPIWGECLDSDAFSDYYETTYYMRGASIIVDLHDARYLMFHVEAP